MCRHLYAWHKPCFSDDGALETTCLWSGVGRKAITPTKNHKQTVPANVTSVPRLILVLQSCSKLKLSSCIQKPYFWCSSLSGNHLSYNGNQDKWTHKHVASIPIDGSTIPLWERKNPHNTAAKPVAPHISLTSIYAWARQQSFTSV